MSFTPAPVTLDGRHARLEPLALSHLPALCEVGLNPETWRFFVWQCLTPDDLRRFIDIALEEQSRAVSVPFATIAKGRRGDDDRLVGSTRFMTIDTKHRKAEIGTTWITPAFQRTAINTEAKLLMLRHAFEVWKCVRVEFKTDSLNEQSRAAIARLGAREEGTHRNHMITWTGRLRHSVYFSIIDSEWPAVRDGLEERLARST
jgi:RimJ/RimL family protein N-acetyltransferase